MHDKKVISGIVFIAALALISLVYNFLALEPVSFFEKVQRSGSLINLSLTRFEDKFACLRSDITAERQYGFLTAAENPTLDAERYILTQFTLAPAVIVRTGGQEFLVGYFPEPVDFEKTIAEHPELVVLKQCGEDTALFQARP